MVIVVPNSSTINVIFTHLLSASFAAKLVTAFVKHLISNSQVLFETITTTFQHIVAYHGCLESISLTIVLGNLATSPKEIYIMEFLNVCADHMLQLDENNLMEQFQREEASERKLLRSLMGKLNDQPLVMTRLHILIRTSRCNPPPNLIPKQLFKLNTHKVSTLTISSKGLFSKQNVNNAKFIMDVGKHSTKILAQDVGENDLIMIGSSNVEKNEVNGNDVKDCKDDLIWYCFKNALIGFAALW
ncbi:14522_t:CDS:2 [Funneliformis caledonium]|uniref:14522_t:CDS:1 n=1 Tax=Funneliformis caledonium TaxID=1117310 RepID=A0A9N9BYN3_9GLOM|nr:14522_t:CDS:2 [Funneliformis caledonium]